LPIANGGDDHCDVISDCASNASFYSNMSGYSKSSNQNSVKSTFSIGQPVNRKIVAKTFKKKDFYNSDLNFLVHTSEISILKHPEMMKIKI
jgi:hypothetical protein